MNMKFRYVLLGMAFIFFNCSSDDLGTTIEEPTEELPEVELKARENIVLTEAGKAINTQVQGFSFELMNILAKERGNNVNYCYSPLGISLVMGMALNGADKDTYEQIQKTLGFGDIQVRILMNICWRYKRLFLK